MDQRTAEPGDPSLPGRPRPAGTFQVGRIAGVPVLVRSSWLLIVLVLALLSGPRLEERVPGLGPWAYVAGLAFALLVYFSVLLHEISHAVMAQRYGLPVRSITLHFLGGATEMEGEPDTPWREFTISVVGPLTSIAAAVGFGLAGLLLDDGIVRIILSGTAAANLLVGVLNLAPGIPLDGGRVVRAAVWRASGNQHLGTIVAGWGGRGCAVLVLLLPFGLSVLGRPAQLTDYLFAGLIAAFLWGGATQAITSARVRRRLPSLSARRLARRVIAVPHDLPLAEAVRRAQAAQAGSIVTLDSSGSPAGIVNEAALLATPADRRPWMPVSAVTRALEEGIRLPVDLAGEPLVLAMQRAPASEYLLLDHDGSVYGVLVTDDVDRAFAADAT